MSRSRAVLILVLAGAAAFVLSLPTWITAEAATTLGPQPVLVSGAGAAPVVPSTALVIVVAGLAVGLSGRVVRILAPAAAALAAVTGLIAVGGVLADPETPARSAAGEISGVRQIAGAAQVSPWPWAVLVVLLLTVVLAVVLPLRAGTWAPAARKYERSAPRAYPDRVDARADWDALSSGIDPSAPPEPHSPDPPEPGDDGADPPATGR